MSDETRVAEIYDSAPEREWSRLDSRRIEFEVTCRALDEHLPNAPARILDVGSGPGRYALRLAGQGYSVSLVDLSGQCLAIAEREAAHLTLQFDRVVCGSATQLTAFPTASFDAVLLLGPLYHLKKEEARAQTVLEALRVLRPDGLLFSAFLNRYSVVRYAAKARPTQLLDDPDFIASILSHGFGDSDKPGAAFLRTCYFSDPQEVRPFMENLGVHTVSTLGCEGVVAEVEEHLNVLTARDLDPWVTLNYRLGQKPELHAASAHLLHIGRRH